MTNTVTISVEEYEELIESQVWEQALQQAGVDNWDGYDEAIQIYQELKGE